MPFPALYSLAASWGRVDLTVLPSMYSNPGSAIVVRLWRFRAESA